jgi:uncharacterized membrane protein YkoI
MPAQALPAAALVALALYAPAMARGDAVHCLGKDQQRAAISSGKAVQLGVALRAARGRVVGEVVKARLCEGPKGLLYMLTVLARDGKVTRLRVDAASGNVVGGL